MYRLYRFTPFFINFRSLHTRVRDFIKKRANRYNRYKIGKIWDNMNTDKTCYYCHKPMKRHEIVTVAHRWFRDHPGGVWDGSRDYPNGLCHVRCDRRWERRHGQTTTITMVRATA